MKWACWIDLVLLAIWGCLYCAEEARLAGRRWDLAVLGCFKRWIVDRSPRMVDSRLSGDTTEWMADCTAKLMADGWVWTGPGVLTSPDGKSTVML